METPEETLEKTRLKFAQSKEWSDWRFFVAGHHGNISQFEIEIFELYHSERLKIEIPTEEEVKAHFGNGLHLADCKRGYNWLKNKLLKGI